MVRADDLCDALSARLCHVAPCDRLRPRSVATVDAHELSHPIGRLDRIVLKVQQDRLEGEYLFNDCIHRELFAQLYRRIQHAQKLSGFRCRLGRHRIRYRTAASIMKPIRCWPAHTAVPQIFKECLRVLAVLALLTHYDRKDCLNGPS